MCDIDPTLYIFSSNQDFSNLVLDRGRGRPREEELLLDRGGGRPREEELLLDRGRARLRSKTNQPTHKKTETGEILLDEISVS